jgi:hypothetical protein
MDNGGHIGSWIQNIQVPVKGTRYTVLNIIGLQRRQSKNSNPQPVWTCTPVKYTRLSNSTSALCLYPRSRNSCEAARGSIQSRLVQQRTV